MAFLSILLNGQEQSKLMKHPPAEIAKQLDSQVEQRKSLKIVGLLEHTWQWITVYKPAQFGVGLWIECGACEQLMIGKLTVDYRQLPNGRSDFG